MTPTYDAYVDDMIERTSDAPNGDLESMQESIDNYVNVYVMLPHGGTLSRGLVIEQNSDADRKPIGKSNENPILDSCNYLVDLNMVK